MRSYRKVKIKKKNVTNEFLNLVTTPSWKRFIPMRTNSFASWEGIILLCTKALRHLLDVRIKVSKRNPFFTGFPAVRIMREELGWNFFTIIRKQVEYIIAPKRNTIPRIKLALFSKLKKKGMVTS